METNSVVYTTGITPDGIILIGGLWKLWEQEGFPIEMAHLVCRDNGCAVDWLEAMADASSTNNCPSLMNHIEAFLPNAVVSSLKRDFVNAHRRVKSYQQIISDKKANGTAYKDSVFRAALVQLFSRDENNGNTTQA